MGSIASNYTASIIGTIFNNFTSAVPHFFGGAKEYFSIIRAERELQLLDDRMLADIGINRGEISEVVRSGKYC